MLNATHDPAKRSWVESANSTETDFPIQNLPFGRFRIGDGAPRCGVAIGASIVDLAVAISAGVLDGEALRAAQAAAGVDLTPLLALGNGPASALRAALSDLLDSASPARPELLVEQSAVEMLLPLAVRQFSDMCVSTFHIGRRRGVDEHGEPICPPVFRCQPVGYDGRASSVVISGTPVRRPSGTWQAQQDVGAPQFGPEPRQDYELELGMWFGGPANPLGTPIPIAAAAESIFGYCLLNDWSSRGLQFWETMLGPFLGKSVATTISPWIVTAEALAPFRARAYGRPPTDPSVPPHLNDHEDQRAGGIDITLDAHLSSARMQREGLAPQRICRSNFRHMYWTPAQMLAHHSSNGCSFAAGDLIGSGTCSGPEIEAAACLAEKLLGGEWTLPGGEPRAWLEDGDTVTLRGRAEAPSWVSVGFGAASGTVLPACL